MSRNNSTSDYRNNNNSLERTESNEADVSSNTTPFEQERQEESWMESNDDGIAWTSSAWYASASTCDNAYASHVLPICHCVNNDNSNRGSSSSSSGSSSEVDEADGFDSGTGSDNDYDFGNSTNFAWSAPVPEGTPLGIVCGDGDVDGPWVYVTSTDADDDDVDDRDDDYNDDSHGPHRRRTITSYLYDLIRQQAWSDALLRIQSHPDDMYYVSRSPTGRTPLHEACRAGTAPIRVARELLWNNPNAALAADGGGNIPLHLLFFAAVHQTVVNTTDVHQGTVTNTRGGTTRPATAAHHMQDDSQEGNEAVVRDLLYIDPQSMPIVQNEMGMTPLHVACLAAAAVSENTASSSSFHWPTVIETLLSANPLCSTMVDENNTTPLCLYCKQGGTSVDIVTMLLGAGVTGEDPMWIADVHGCIPLHYAAQYVHADIVRFLLERDAGVALVADKNGQGPLHLACKYRTGGENIHDHRRQIQTVQLLLDSSSPIVLTWKDNQREQTPLHRACRVPRPSCDVIKSILRVDPTCASLRDHDDYTPLHHICECNEANNANDAVAIVSLLVASPRISSRVTKKRDTPLHLACGTNSASPEAVDILLNSFPDATAMKNDYGYTPLHCLCRTRHPDVKILTKLLNVCPASVLMPTNSGETPLHLVCNVGTAMSGGGGSDVGNTLNIARVLLEAQRDVSSDLTARATKATTATGNATAFPPPATTMTNKVGNTPLHEVCFHGRGASSVEMVRLLAAFHPEWLTWKNDMGYTPVHLASKTHLFRDVRLLRTLRDCGGDYYHRGHRDCREERGRSHDDGDENHDDEDEGDGDCEAENNIFAVTDKSGNTPLHSACHGESTVSVIQFLIDSYPRAALKQTVYGDTLLHLCVLRGAHADVVRAIAEAAAAAAASAAVNEGEGRRSGERVVLAKNLAGVTPLDIAMDQFRNLYTSRRRKNLNGNRDEQLCVTNGYTTESERDNVYQVVNVLIKVLYYGTAADYFFDDEDGSKSPTRIVHATLNVRGRGDVDIDTDFVRLVILYNPEQVSEKDRDGNYPIHIEARVIGKDNATLTRHEVSSDIDDNSDRIVNEIVRRYPEGVSVCNSMGEFPLALMIKSGRRWDDIKTVFMAFPPTLTWCDGMVRGLLPDVAAKVGQECGLDTMFQLLENKPDYLEWHA